MPERNPSGYPQNSLSWKYSEEGESSSRIFDELPETGGPQVKNGSRSASAGSRKGQHQHQHVGLRVRRAILSGRRAGPSTPVPSWKLYENPFYDGVAAAAAAAAAKQRGLYRASAGAGVSSGVAISARTLAATLWELQEPASLTALKKTSPHPLPSMGSHVRRPSPLQLRQARDSSPLHALGHDLLHADPLSPSKFYQHSGKASEGIFRHSNPSRQAAAMRSHVHRLQERRDARLLSPCILSPSNGNSAVVEPQKLIMSPNAVTDRRLKLHESEYPTTSSELLKVLNRIRDLEEQHSSSTSMAAALKIELEHARSRIHELEKTLKLSRREVDSLLKKFAEERLHWQAKEQDRIRAAVQTLKAQVEDERKGRRRMDIVNRKIARELAECNMALAKALQDLDREKKARELMEDVCDELAREIGEDKAEVEELRRESAKVREEVEEERKMLQMAEVWREERVQMKLGEARLELEERNDALDHMRTQLENFLQSRKPSAGGNQIDVDEAEKLRYAVTSLQLKEPRVLSGKAEISGDIVSADEDLHTIELSREGRPNDFSDNHDSGFPLSTQNTESVERSWNEDGRVHAQDGGSQEPNYQGRSVGSQSGRWEEDNFSNDTLDDGSAREWIYTESGVIERRYIRNSGGRGKEQQGGKVAGAANEGDSVDHIEDEDRDADADEEDGDGDGDEESQWESASEEDEVDDGYNIRTQGETDNSIDVQASQQRTNAGGVLVGNPSDGWRVNQMAGTGSSSRFQEDDSSHLNSSRDYSNQVESSREYSGQCDYSEDFLTPFSQDATRTGMEYGTSVPTSEEPTGSWSEFVNPHMARGKGFVGWQKGYREPGSTSDVPGLKPESDLDKAQSRQRRG